MTMAINFRNKRGWEGAPLLRQLTRRNRPWMGLFFALTFLALPLQYMLAIFYWPVELYDSTVYSGNPPSMPAWAPNYTPSRIFTKLSLIQFGVLVTAGAILIALWQTHWLRSRRQGEFWHSLPVKRENLLLVQAGAAWLTIALPLMADYLVVLIAGAVRFAQAAGVAGDYFVFPVGEILLDLLGWLVVSLAIIALIFLVSTMTGGLIKTVVLSGVLMGPLSIMGFMSDEIVQRFVVGSDGVSLDVQKGFLYSSPVLVMPARYGSYNTFWGTYDTRSNWMLLLWLVIGLLCLWFARRISRTRPVELAGTGTVREPLGLVVTLLATLTGGLSLGMIFWEQGRSFFSLVCLCSLGVAVLCQVVLKWDLQRLRAFRRHPDLRGLWKPLLVLVLCMALPGATAFVVTHGALGYEDYIPPAAEVQQLRVRYRGRYGSLARRMDSKDPSEHLSETGETWYSYNDQQYVTFTTPEGIQAGMNLHRSLLEWQKGAGEGRQGHLGHTDFLYNNEMMRIYGQWRGSNQFYEGERDLTALLALEENLEFRRQTDPRFTITSDQVRAVRVSDDVGLTTSNPITDKDTIQRLLVAMKTDAQAMDYSALREGTAQAVAYLTVETTAPVPWYNIPASQPGETRRLVTEDLWRDFCLPVYQKDKATLDFLQNGGLVEYTGQFLSREKITGLRVNWWGDIGITQEAYWTGIGPRDLWPGRSDYDEDIPVTILDDRYKDQESSLVLTDPVRVEELLGLCRGRDCHVSEPGFVVMVLGENGRRGSSFWLCTQDEAPQFLLDWLQENERAVRGTRGLAFQHLP